MSISHYERSHLTQSAAGLSILVAMILIAIQLYAFFVTNAMVILASVLESVMDAFAAAAALFALRTAHRGPDHNHRYGHGKAEPLVTLGQAGFIGGSGIYFIIEALRRMVNPEPIGSTNIGIVIMLLSTVIIIALLCYQNRVIHRTDSMSIKADFLHYLNDAAVNGLVIVSLFLSGMLHDHWIDEAASVIIAIYILYAAYRLGCDAARELMDAELDDGARQHILGIIRANKFVSGVHDLRTRRSGPDVFIEAHIEMPPQMTLLAAHEVTDQVEQALKLKFPNSHITLHQEPEGIVDHRLDDHL